MPNRTVTGPEKACEVVQVKSAVGGGRFLPLHASVIPSLNRDVTPPSCVLLHSHDGVRPRSASPGEAPRPAGD